MSNRHPRRLRIEEFERVAYAPMLVLQEARHAQVLARQADDTLFLLEHEPVITLGRNACDNSHILVSSSRLETLGMAVHATGRGGDVTYHGPGQLVGYPIVHLQPGERDVRAYVWRLEEICIRTAADFGVTASRIDGLRGVWVGDTKLAAVGVRLSRWTTMHGFALNLAGDLPGFDLIVPCGLHGHGVTSLQRLLGDTAPSAERVRRSVILHAAQILSRNAVGAPPSAVARAA